MAWRFHQSRIHYPVVLTDRYSCVRVVLAVKKYLFPIELGVTIGLVSCWRAGMGQYQYCSTHYYFYLGLKALAGAVNFAAFRWAIALFLVYLGIELCERFGDRHRLSAILLPLTLICTYKAAQFHQSIQGESLYSDLTHAFDGWNRADTLEAVRGGMPQIIVALLALVLGLMALKWVRGRNGERQVGQQRVGLCSLVGLGIVTIVSTASTVMSRLRLVLVPFVAAFILINLAMGVICAERSLNRRHRPNVVLIMIDTLRADHLGCYGYPRRTTPNIDRFAASSTRFEHAVSQAPWTDWSVASFCPGSIRKPLRLRWAWILPCREFLADQGYETGGIVSNLSMYDSINGSTHRRFGYWDASPWHHARDISSPAVLSSTLAWLSKVKDRRFFLFSLFVDPHSPYIKHKEYDFDPQNNGRMPDYIDVTVKETTIRPVPLPCELQHMEAVYDSEIAFTDEHVGRLLDRLKKDGLYDDSPDYCIG